MRNEVPHVHQKLLLLIVSIPTYLRRIAILRDIRNRNYNMFLIECGGFDRRLPLIKSYELNTGDQRRIGLRFDGQRLTGYCGDETFAMESHET